MWKEFFPNSLICGVDLHEKRFSSEDRVKIFQGNQVDEVFLKSVVTEIGGLDIVIDDGSHINDHVIKTFQVLFPMLSERGIYVIEDLQTSYWPSFGGDSENLQNPSTSMNFLKTLTDCLNHKELLRVGYVPSYYDKHITSMHFYHNLVFVYKGRIDEESNLVKDNVLPPSVHG